MPNGTVRLAWGDGEYDFNIAKIGHLLELEEKCKAGIAEIFDRLRSGLGVSPKWYANDVRETVRIGLIGGGQEPVKALLLTQRYCDERPLRESLETAFAIMLAAIVGVPGDDVGKKPKRRRTKTQAATASSAPKSTNKDTSSDTAQDKSTNSPFGNSPPASMDTTNSTEKSA